MMPADFLPELQAERRVVDGLRLSLGEAEELAEQNAARVKYLEDCLYRIANADRTADHLRELAGEALSTENGDSDD